MKAERPQPETHCQLLRQEGKERLVNAAWKKARPRESHTTQGHPQNFFFFLNLAIEAFHPGLDPLVVLERSGRKNKSCHPCSPPPAPTF